MYQAVTYADIAEFNKDAQARSDQLIAERNILTYDRPWMVDQVVWLPTVQLLVVWRRLEPAKKRK